MDIGKSALELLAGEKKGLELNKIIKSLELEEVVSSRTVRNALNDLVNDGRLERRKLPSGGRGKPPYVYILPSFLPEELRMIEDAPLKVITKTEAELEELDRLEQNRRWQGLTALDTIARGHIQEDRFAEAIVKIAPRIASKCPAKLLTSMAKWVVDDISPGDCSTKSTSSSFSLNLRMEWGMGIRRCGCSSDPSGSSVSG